MTKDNECRNGAPDVRGDDGESDDDVGYGDVDDDATNNSVNSNNEDDDLGGDGDLIGGR